MNPATSLHGLHLTVDTFSIVHGKTATAFRFKELGGEAEGVC